MEEQRREAAERVRFTQQPRRHAREGDVGCGPGRGEEADHDEPPDAECWKMLISS